MKVCVKLFAAAREIIGGSEIDVEATEGASIAEVRTALRTAVPHLASLLLNSRWAVNNEFVTDATLVDENSEVALIPPVSGG